MNDKDEEALRYMIRLLIEIGSPVIIVEEGEKVEETK